MVTAINGDSREDVEEIAAMVAEGTLRPVIDRRFLLSEVREAYRHVEGRHRRGAVILEVAPGPVSVAAA